MEKKFKNGLVLGKMMPTTMGHKHLIDSAAKQCETVHVMMCSRKSEPIDGRLRFTWLHKMYKDNPNVNIIHCDDENPQYPHEDIHFWDIWYSSVYSYIDKLDAVFGSEDYIKPFAKCLEVEGVIVDIDRKSVPISATMVREDPHKYWDYIPDVVKPYYTKKIVVVGTESTGKSTLVKKIAEKFNMPYVEEYGREYTDSLPSDNELTKEDFNHIAMRHSDRIREALGEKFLVVDTEAITTLTFGQLYLNDEFETNELRSYISTQKFDLWLFLKPDIPWCDDGTRDFPDRREEHYDKIVRQIIISIGDRDIKNVKGLGKKRTDMAYGFVKDFMEN